MPTAIISDTTWAATSASLREAQVRVRPYSLPRSRGILIGAEMLLLATACVQALYSGRNAGVIILIACCEFFYHVNDLDRAIANFSARGLLTDVAESITMGGAAAGLAFYWWPSQCPRAGSALVAILVTGALPLLLRPVLKRLTDQGKLVDGVLIAGTGELAGKLYRALANKADGRQVRRIDGVLEIADGMAERGTAIDATEFGEMVSRARIARVIVAEQDPESRATLADALLASRLRGLKVDDAVDFYERLTGKIWVEAISSEWFVYTNGFAHSKMSARLERLVDGVLALLMIVATAPIMILTAAAVKLSSAGPVLFRQARVGANGETFVIYKFRSMREDAERTTGPVWTEERDDRVTAVGRVLRKYRLDELPQAFNVLRGEMSMVGPRPERPCFVDRLNQLIPFYSCRQYVKPGITGWAQVMFPYGASIEDAREKLQYDLYYVKHRSIACNAWILLKTVKIVLFGRGR